MDTQSEQGETTIEPMDLQQPCDVAIIGAGVSGLTAGIFTSRAGLSTTIVDGGNPILRRNAHLENHPGFPAGVNGRLFLEMTREQARRTGCSFFDRRVTSIRHTANDENGRFQLKFADDETITATRVIAASWSDSSYLDELAVECDQRGSKQYIQTDADGHTDIEGLYAAGRLAKQYHQTVISAGHGAQVAITVIHDSDTPFYHDWVTPDGYFTGRGREIPPGCEEIDAQERRRREKESMAIMQEYFAEMHADEQATHPSLTED